MSGPRAVDVHGFGGGFTLGTVEAGWDLVAKVSRDKGFGVLNTMANRHKLPGNWESILAKPDEWDQLEVFPAELVFGNPPCSGFSTLSSKAFRGMDSSINDYMWEVIDYAGRVAPEMVIWESVQQTFRQGLPLMRQLHQRLQEMTGHTYTLTHALHNNASVGGTSLRKRYFWVASRVPFGVDHGRITRQGEHMPLDGVSTFNDMLRDLLPLGLTMHDQPYRGTEIEHVGHGRWEDCTHACQIYVQESSRWCRREIHDGTGLVDGHDIMRSPSLERVQELLHLADWKEGETISAVLRKYYEEHGDLPSLWYYPTKEDRLDDDGNPVLDEDGNVEKVILPKAERLIKTDFAMGHNQNVRWHGTKLPRVITGGGVHLIVHPTLDRTLTHREVARTQGFPDDWKIWPVRNAPDLGPSWGKGVPVQAGRWISRWARASLEGQPGPITGIPLLAYDKKLHAKFGEYDNEFVLDITNDYKPYAVAIGDRG